MVDPLTAYQVAMTAYRAYQGTRFVVGKVDERVAAYAAEQGKTKAEVWAEIRREAERRGDEVIMQLADSPYVRTAAVLAPYVLLGPLAGSLLSPVVDRVIRKRQERADRAGTLFPGAQL